MYIDLYKNGMVMEEAQWKSKCSSSGLGYFKDQGSCTAVGSPATPLYSLLPHIIHFIQLKATISNSGAYTYLKDPILCVSLTGFDY